MANGFEVYADNGTLLINNNMIGWFCARTGRAQTGTKTGPGNTVSSEAVIPTSGSGWSLTYPLSAMRIDGDYGMARGSNQWQTGYHRYITNAPLGTWFTWYLFDYAPRLPVINQGLEIYRDDGQRAFSSAYYPFKPKQNIRTGAIYTPGYYLAISGPSAGGYAKPNEDSGYHYYRNGQLVPEEEDWDQYSFTNDSKLYGGRIVGPDYAEPFNVSFDDVVIGPRNPPIVTRNWNAFVPVLAVDVSNIAISTVYF